MNVRHQTVPLLVLPAILCGLGRAEDRPIIDLGSRMISPSREIVTPHIAWARPFAQGKLRVLFMGGIKRMREVVELAQRLEMEYAFWGAWGDNLDDLFRHGYLRRGYYKGDGPGDKEQRLRMLLADADYDLIVMGAIDWRGLPLFAKYEILRRVHEGAGLVKMGTRKGANKDDYLLRATKRRIEVPSTVAAGVPWQALPLFAHYSNAADLLASTLKASQLGEGRIIELKDYHVPEWHLISPGFTRDPLVRNWADWWAVRTDEFRESHTDFDMPMTDVKVLDYDYYLAYLIKVMLFAAKKAPAITIAEDGTILSTDRRSPFGIEFAVTCDAEQVDLTADMVLRDRDNAVIASASRDDVTLASGRNALTFSMPSVPAGSYFADLWLRQDGRVVTFGTKALKVNREASIHTIKLDRDSFKVEDTVTGKLQIHRGSLPLDSLRLVIRRLDNLGRLVGERALKPTSPAISLRLEPIPGPATVHQHVEAELRSGEDIIDRRRLTFTLSNLYLEDPIRLVAWERAVISYLAFRTYQRLYDVGFDSAGNFCGNDRIKTHLFGLGPRATFKVGRFEIAGLSNLQFIPPAARITDAAMYAKYVYTDFAKREKIQVEANVRQPCLNDPQYLSRMQRRVQHVVEHYSPYSTREYIFDQEPCFTQFWHRKDSGEVCFCARCQRYFHEYLKQQYGTIDAANTEYETQYGSFDEIEPVKLADVKANPKLAPLWADFRMAMDASHSGFYETLTQTMRSIQPEAKTGEYAPIYQGFRSFDAADMWRMSRWQGVSQPYPTATEQIRVDFAPPGSLMGRGCWWGPAHSRSKEFAGMHPWRDLFEGFNFFYSYCGDTGMLLAYDLSMFDDMKHRMAQLREIKRGIGRLLHEAKRDHGGVALLYSIASIHHWVLTEGGLTTQGGIKANYSAWVAALADADQPFRFVSYEQLAKGEVTADKFRLLILPWSQAISPAEAARIKAFVTDGGTVLADLRPGVSDGHCKPYDKSPLDEVFGVVQNTKTSGIATTMVTLPAAEGGKPEPFGVVRCDETLKLAGGRAEGLAGEGTPALIHNRCGNGQALLLNFSIDHYLVRKERSIHAPGILTLLDRLLRSTSLDRPVRVAPKLKSLRHFRFLSGNAEYVCLMQDLPEPLIRYAAGTARPLSARRIAVQFAKAAHIHDAREKRYLGHTDRVTTYVTPGVGKVFALMPYRVSRLSLTAPPSVAQGAAIDWAVTLSGALGSEKHILHVSLTDPQGHELRHYSRNVACNGGKATGKLHLALDEKVGAYRLVVTDAATGASDEEQIAVRQRKASS